MIHLGVSFFGQIIHLSVVFVSIRSLRALGFAGDDKVAELGKAI